MDDRIKTFDEKMSRTYSNMIEEMGTIRAGRANPNILNRVRVNYYGAPTPLQQVSNITVPEPRVLQITPWEKTMIKEIEKAINKADIGINPTNDGQSIRLVFPELTEERRKELVKEVKKIGENSKVAVRNIRREANEYLKKLGKGDISEDQIKDLEDDVQDLTDQHIREIDKAVEEKSKEILTV